MLCELCEGLHCRDASGFETVPVESVPLTEYADELKFCNMRQ